MTGARGQAECTVMTAPTTVDIPAPSAPRTPTFLTGPEYRSAIARHVPDAPHVGSSGVGEVTAGPHRPMTSSERSAEPRAQRDSTLPIWYSPAGRPPRPLPTVRAAMVAQRGKKGDSAETLTWAMDYSPGRSRDTIERPRGTQPGPSAPSGRSRRARGRPCGIPG